jgi:flagellar protein FlgJ
MDFTIDPRAQLSHPVNSPLSGKKERQLASLRQSSQDFETLLVNEMYKSMRKSVPDGGLFKKDSATEMFQEMMDMETAKATTQASSLGIADAIYKQMADIVEKTK